MHIQNANKTIEENNTAIKDFEKVYKQQKMLCFAHFLKHKTHTFDKLKELFQNVCRETTTGIDLSDSINFIELLDLVKKVSGIKPRVYSVEEGLSLIIDFYSELLLMWKDISNELDPTLTKPDDPIMWDFAIDYPNPLMPFPIALHLDPPPERVAVDPQQVDCYSLITIFIRWIKSFFN
jgi:hypothetical protein